MPKGLPEPVCTHRVDWLGWALIEPSKTPQQKGDSLMDPWMRFNSQNSFLSDLVLPAFPARLVRVAEIPFDESNEIFVLKVPIGIRWGIERLFLRPTEDMTPFQNLLPHRVAPPPGEIFHADKDVANVVALDVAPLGACPGVSV